MAERQYINPDDDRQLLQAVAAADTQAFELLYKKYGGILERYVLFIAHSREVAEEIIQDVFLSLWRNREKLPALVSFRAYLFHIARNRVISHFRSIRAKKRLLPLDESAPWASHAEADHQLIFNEYYQMALKAIETLPEQKKKVFRLSLEENMTLDEMAHRLGISKSTVKQHLYGASSAIRTYLKKKGNITASLLAFLAFLRF